MGMLSTLTLWIWSPACPPKADVRSQGQGVKTLQARQEKASRYVQGISRRALAQSLRLKVLLVKLYDAVNGMVDFL